MGSTQSWYGIGIEKDLLKDIKLLNNAAEHYDKNASKWAKGFIVGAIGEYGYFSKNIDALLAHYHLANIYYSETQIKNISKANYHIQFVLSNKDDNKSKEDLFFCCQFDGNRVITHGMINDLYSKIKSHNNL